MSPVRCWIWLPTINYADLITQKKKERNYGFLLDEFTLRAFAIAYCVLMMMSSRRHRCCCCRCLCRRRQREKKKQCDSFRNSWHVKRVTHKIAPELSFTKCTVYHAHTMHIFTSTVCCVKTFKTLFDGVNSLIRYIWRCYSSTCSQNEFRWLGKEWLFAVRSLHFRVFESMDFSWIPPRLELLYGRMPYPRKIFLVNIGMENDSRNTMILCLIHH